MKASQEDIIIKSEESFQCFQVITDKLVCPYHYHPEIEIVHIQSGRGQRLIGDFQSDFGKGDFVLIGSGLPHMYTQVGDDTVKSYCLQFKAQALGTDFLKIPEMAKIAAMLERAKRGMTFSNDVEEKAKKILARANRVGAGPARICALIELLELLSEDEGSKCLASLSYNAPSSPKELDRQEKVINYLNQHWPEPIKLAEVAKIAGLHPNSFSRFFRKCFRRTFQQYLIELRLSHAARLLLENNDTITGIAFDCGFSDLSNFNRQFLKNYGSTPRDYRKRLSTGRK